MPHQYILDLSIFSKNKKLKREGDITGLLEVTVEGIFQIKIDASQEAFGVAMDVIGSTRRCIIVDKFVVMF